MYAVNVYKTYEQCANMKEYLNQVFNIDMSINAQLEKIEYYRNLATKASGVCKIRTTGGKSNRSRIEDYVCKIMELEDDVNSNIAALVALKTEFEGIISKIKRPELKQMMEIRYICGKTWQQVAEHMNYSIVTIWRLHKQALQEIENSNETLHKIPRQTMKKAE